MKPQHPAVSPTLRVFLLVLLILATFLVVSPFMALPRGVLAENPTLTKTTVAYLPVINRQMAVANPCGPIPNESYGTLSVNPPSSDRPAEAHPDLNLGLRGYTFIGEARQLVDYGGSSDASAPQLAGLFANQRGPNFTATYRVYEWDWAGSRPGALVSNPPVTLVGLAASVGETLHVPSSGYTIGDGYEVLVLYVGADRITLKYTREDNVVQGYTLHVENICPEPRLLQLYNEMVSAGRQRLPALRAGQAFGRARGDQVGVAIRDHGSFMDPRSRKDWWRGY